jgi:hypothetical protein
LEIDLAEHKIDQTVQEVVFAGDVVVQGHRLDPEVLAEAPHAQRPDAVTISELDRGPQHAIPGQRRSALGFPHVLTKLTLYV